MQYILLMTVLCSMMLYFGYLKFKTDALSALAVGGAVSSNLYNAVDYGIKMGEIYFGIDAVIYTFFLACVVISLFEFGKKQAFNLMYNSINAIMFSAVVAFVVALAQEGWNSEMLTKLLSYTINSASTALTTFCIWWVYKPLKEKVSNKYLLCGILITFGSIINTFSYFSVMAVLATSYISPHFWSSLLGAYITKLICVAVACLTYYLLAKSKTRTSK